MPYSEVNIVATMSSRKPKPDDAPPSPGHVRIVVDSPGITVENAEYEMGFPGWHGRVSRLNGLATLRFSSDASETRPGLMSFVYEIAQMSAESGELVLGTKEGAGEFVFPLRNVALRRFGARASRRQDLVFRGQMEVAGAAVEVWSAAIAEVGVLAPQRIANELREQPHTTRLGSVRFDAKGDADVPSYVPHVWRDRRWQAWR